MADEPLVSKEDRPDLTVNMEGKVGDLTVRDLATILGVGPEQLAKSKEVPATAIDKLPLKEIQKDVKDHKDVKDNKDHKEPKDHKDQKDTKDHKDPKEQKDQKDQKDPKDHKDQKDVADQKAHKDPKDTKDQKDHKDPKEHKDQKDSKDHKETIKDHKEFAKEVKEPIDVQAPNNPAPGPQSSSTLDQLIHRISGLEQAIDEMKKSKK